MQHTNAALSKTAFLVEPGEKKYGSEAGLNFLPDVFK